ncbi:hypothetical protein BBO99_00000190 [Phytophthora kernoviae]|uniref:Cytochrome P450 n=2 Tax=Phytophthora kernoviae TaxID=325452 RepID=A0A3R7J033_9STRA|nr:hypothetical protein G195_001373 [Phytophthora kernoviae 00238/432]KAG2531491.1 hypothetical protein JM18_000348 [Phytophthora kernoviae]KAG2532633.1 hypothetical protein JM16_000243 [Phytophthora kernoviae]RLM96809.1 hypothetical protein BBI17_000292 [Phytophthora kernoviae]RLN85797.1 hypothetical protein BBO99_00000190 [Phytophthora kernoviae]
MIHSGLDIVEPMCVRMHEDGSDWYEYDLNAWIGRRKERGSLRNSGTFVPGDLWVQRMSNFHGEEETFVPLDSVGGTMLYVKADVHRQVATAAIAALYVASIKAFKGVEAKKLPEGVDAPVPVPYISPGLPILGHTMDMVHNADRFLDWLPELCQSTDGKPFMLRLLGRSDLLIDADPEHHGQILKTQYNNFIKGDQFYEMLVDVAGPIVVLIEGECWKYQRKVLVSLFSTRVLRKHMMPIVQKHTRTLLDIFREAAVMQKPIELGELMHRFTLDLFAEIGFDSKLGSLKSGEERSFGKALDDALHIAAARRMAPMWLWKAKRWLNMGSGR